MAGSQRLGELRARRALAQAGMDPDAPLAALESVTNDVYRAGDVVVRLNRRTHPRLRREASLAAHLPPEVRYPAVVAASRDRGDDWVLLRHVDGTPLVRCWPAMDTADRRRAVSQFTAAVRALHATPAPPDLPDAVDPPQALQPGALATDPLCEALERAASLPHVDAGALRDAIGWVRILRTALDPFEAPTLIHGDLHFQNVLWDGRDITALLDFEFARPAPPDLDLDVFLRFCCLPFLYVPVGRESEARPEEYLEVPFWFREAYPEVFAHPRQLDRLRLYAVAFDVRDLLRNPPTRASAELTRHHPYRRLLSTLRGHGHLDLLARQ
jgi:aminoglycoside phosphotransferase (APT) family kinase protein